MRFATDFSPIRGLADIEALERVPLEERIRHWDIKAALRFDAARRAFEAALGARRGAEGKFTVAVGADELRGMIVTIALADAAREDDVAAVMSACGVAYRIVALPASGGL